MIKKILVLIPQAFGPGSWRGVDERLARVYSAIVEIDPDKEPELENKNKVLVSIVILEKKPEQIEA